MSYRIHTSIRSNEANKIDKIKPLYEEKCYFVNVSEKHRSIKMEMYLYTPSSMYHLAIWIPNKCMKKIQYFPGFFGNSRDPGNFKLIFQSTGKSKDRENRKS